MAIPKTAATSTDACRQHLMTPHSRYTWWLLALILMLSFIIDLFFFRGYMSHDDTDYFWAAVSLLENGTLGVEHVYGAERLVIVGWSTLVAWIFGPNVQLMAGSFILFHQMLTVFTFFVAWRAFDRSAGLLAAYYVATVPLIVIYSSCILSDVPLACFLMLSFLLFTYAYELAKRGSMRTSRLCICSAGIAVGLAYCVKESGLILLPFYFFLWLWNERFALTSTRQKVSADKGCTRPAPGGRQRRSFKAIRDAITTGVFFIIGFLLVFAAESAILAQLYDKPFFRLAWTMEEVDLNSIDMFHVNGGFDPAGRFKAFIANLNYLHFPRSLKILFLASIVLYPFMRRKKWAVLLAGLWIFAYMTWGSASFTQYYPPCFRPRYFIPVIPFLCIAMAIVLMGVMRRVQTIPVPRPVGRLIYAVAMAAIILIPLLNLDVADRFAGRGSRASFVGNAVKAIEVARGAARESGRPVVLSGVVIHRLRPLFYNHRPSDLFMADELTEAEIEQFLEQGGLYYVDNNQRALLEVSGRRQNRVDDLLHGIVLAGQGGPDARSATLHPASELALPRRGRLDVGDLAVIKLANFSTTPSRTVELSTRLLKTVPREYQTCDHGWSVDLYKVVKQKRQGQQVEDAFEVAGTGQGITLASEDH